MTLNSHEATESGESATVTSARVDGEPRPEEEEEQSKEDEKPKSTPSTSDTELEQQHDQPKSKKRTRSSEDDDIILSPEALSKMNRAERKRHRERKRRNDVNKGFDDLMELLLEIDPVVRAEAEERASLRLRGNGQHCKGNGAIGSGNTEDSILSRVELIGRAVEVLRRTHRENEERKAMIRHLVSQQTIPFPTPTMSLPGLQQVCHSHLPFPQWINPVSATV
jgi:hypothetical protein